MTKHHYEDYEDIFNPLRYDRQARRRRKPKVNHRPKKTQQEIIQEVVAPIGLEAGFNTTYQPSIFEEEWLLSSLRDFYVAELITDVLALVRGGKEASVYRCAANPNSGETLLAAKVYRPRKFRNLRNDKMYREGRAILKSNGKAVKANDHRILRAVGKKSAFGEQIEHTSWLMYEYTTLQTLYQAGAAVPRPIAASDNAILMTYHGDSVLAAPTLNEIDLDPQQAQTLFREALRNIELMLEHDLIHGDLSAYNILYWKDAITLIDFPQVTNSRTNSNAAFILGRDIGRVCEYFQRQGVDCDAEAITQRLWQRYLRGESLNRVADASKTLQED